MIKKYLTDINNQMYLKEELIKINNEKNSNTIKILDNEIIGEFYGFGSAITESSAYNYSQLSDNNKKKFIDDYYCNLNYHYGRISIGSNDFSLGSYSYSKKRDLSDFDISRDKQYVIPFLKDIISIKDISIIASPWSPPVMFKTIPTLYWGVKLSKKYYDEYSNYLVRFINEYQKNGIKIEYLTMQNEPMARQRWESCKYSIQEQRDFIYHHLLDKLHNTRLLLWDHNKDDLYNTINSLYQESDKIAGFAFHYYTGNNFSELKKIREKYPNKLLINTEMCCAYTSFDEKKWLSSAEYYLNDIIGDMNNGVNAYLDWNILLDEKGGPTYKNNPVKSAIIRVGDSYLKTPIYYYLYHISHFIRNKATIIKNVNNLDLKVVALKIDRKTIVVVMNKTNNESEFNLLINKNTVFDIIKAHSIITYEIY